ncbi:tetratricopeptide repeat protein [Aquimarina sediminis]|uniref:tetratricopeptide repeat protein n=1 Tax=Aquimarina sediminis TaxID=2070536 RepID=UPI000CA08DDC|nr:tetratricopeptide repeat protein [Aquimarina sediminis]
MKKITLVVFIHLFALNVFSQNQTRIDSLLQVLKTKITEKEKVDIYNFLAIEHAESDSTKTIYFSNLAIKIAKQIKYSEGSIDSYHQIAWTNMKFGRYKRAIDIFRKTLPLIEKTNYLNGYAKMYSGLGTIYNDQGNYSKALDYYEKLIEVRKKLKKDKDIADAYVGVSRIYYNQANYPKALDYLTQALELIEDSNHINLVSKIYTNMGIIYSKQGDFDNALVYHLKSLEIIEKSGHKRDLASTYLNIGINYVKQGNYTKALSYNFKALKISQELEDQKGTARSYNNIGGIYHEQGKYVKALEHYHKSLQIKEKLGLKRGVSSSCNNIAIIYYRKKNYPKALEYHQKAIKIREEIKDKRGLASSFLNIGNVYLAQENYLQSTHYYEKALSNSQEIGNKPIMAKTFNALGEVQLRLGNYLGATKYLSQGVNLSKELGYLSALRYGTKLLSDTHKALGNYKLALENYEMYHSTYDSLLGKEKSKQISQLQVQYETEKKEQKIKSLAQQASIQSLQLKQANFNKTIFGAICIVLLLLGLILYLISRQKRLALKQKAQNIEQNLLRVQMNPHFIFNAMTSIQDFMNQGDARQASMYLVKFSKLIRQVLDNSRTEFISLEQEINMLDNYLSIQNLKREYPFNFKIEVEDGLLSDEITIPPMFAQPFIENAIEHGFSSIKEGAIIRICFSVEKDHLVLKISDNGSGIEEAMSIKRKNHESHAIKITTERIDLYRRMQKKRISFDIQDLSQGTQVTFNLPFQYL